MESFADQAKQAYVTDDIDAAVVLLQKGAEAGEGECQALLGGHYHQGVGVPEDIPRSIELYQQAASQGNVTGTFLLGRTLYLGLGVEEDEATGLLLLTRAAFMNFVDAQMLVAEHYQRSGTEAEFYLSIAWCLIAAQNGSEQAQAIVAQASSPPPEAVAIAERLHRGILSVRQLWVEDPDACVALVNELVSENLGG